MDYVIPHTGNSNVFATKRATKREPVLGPETGDCSGECRRGICWPLVGFALAGLSVWSLADLMGWPGDRYPRSPPKGSIHRPRVCVAIFLSTVAHLPPSAGYLEPPGAASPMPYTLQGSRRPSGRAISPDGLFYSIHAPVRLILIANASYRLPHTAQRTADPGSHARLAAGDRPPGDAHPPSPIPQARCAALAYGFQSDCLRFPIRPGRINIFALCLPNSLCPLHTHEIGSLDQKDFGEEVAIFGSLAGIHKARI